MEEYSIPVAGLSEGLHHFDFRVNDPFFGAFENTPVEKADLSVHVEFEKRPSMYVLELTHEGTVRTTCDRCLEEIDLPVSGSFPLVVKFSEEELPEEAEVVYVHPETSRLNLAKYIFEFVVLSLPLIKVYDCEADPDAVCNEETLKFLDRQKDADEAPVNPLKEALKNWKKEN